MFYGWIAEQDMERLGYLTQGFGNEQEETGMTGTHISRLKNGRLERFEFDRLLRFSNKLDMDVELRVKEKHQENELITLSMPNRRRGTASCLRLTQSDYGINTGGFSCRNIVGHNGRQQQTGGNSNLRKVCRRVTRY